MMMVTSRIVLGVEALVVLGLQFRFVRLDALEIRVQEHRDRYSVQNELILKRITATRTERRFTKTSPVSRAKIKPIKIRRG
jgi:hypothetical protein